MIKNICSVFAILAFSSVVHAGSSKLLTVKCEGADTQFVNQFNLSAQIEVEAGVLEGQASGLVQGRLVTEGRNPTPVNLAETVSGTFRVLEPGMLSKNELVHLSLFKKTDGKVELYLSLLLDYPGTYNSFIRTVDGREYRSRCELL